MKSILLIGLGRFGKHVAMHLHNLGHQVMAVDSTEERVNAVLPYVTEAQIGDSTNESFLSSLGILLMYYFSNILFVKIFAIILIIISILAIILVGKAIYSGKKNINKIVDQFSFKYKNSLQLIQKTA